LKYNDCTVFKRKLTLPFSLVQPNTGKSSVNPFCPMKSMKLGPLRDAVGIIESFSKLAKFDGFDKICGFISTSDRINDFVLVEKIVIFVVEIPLGNLKIEVKQCREKLSHKCIRRLSILPYCCCCFRRPNQHHFLLDQF
jgi:hypothetical protein